MPTVQPSKKNTSIEGLRGFLAVSVLGFHIYKMGEKVDFYRSLQSPIVDAIGPFAVCLFFCVSGYLIIQTLAKMEDLRAFFRNRALRIYPVFLVLHLILFTAGPLVGYAWMGTIRHQPGAYLEAFVSNLLFLPGLFDLPIAQKNAWSLSYEAAFYVAAAALYWSARRMPRLSGMAGLAISCCAAAVVLWLHPNSGFFLIGVSLFLLVRAGRLPEIRWFVAIPCLILALCSFAFLPSPLSMMFSWLFFAAVVQGSGLVGTLLSAPPMRWLGRISYSLYLVHPFAMDFVRTLLLKVAAKSHLLPNGLLFLILAPACALIASQLSFELLEKRLTRFISGRERSSPKPHISFVPSSMPDVLRLAPTYTAEIGHE